MNEGVSFNGTHNYNDWGIIMTDMDIGLPEVQTNYVEVPGRDGPIDLSTALTGEVKYNQRTLTFTFETVDRISKSNWASLLSKIATDIHGQRLMIVLDDDKEFYYMGRCALDEYKTQYGLQTITIVCDCDPYKYDSLSPGTPWLWDPFSFVDGIIYNNQMEVDGTAVGEYINRAKRVTPTFICSADMTVTVNGYTYSLKAGTNYIYEITLDPNTTTEMTFTGYGTVNVTYETGVL